MESFRAWIAYVGSLQLVSIFSGLPFMLCEVNCGHLTLAKYWLYHNTTCGSIYASFGTKAFMNSAPNILRLIKLFNIFIKICRRRDSL